MNPIFKKSISLASAVIKNRKKLSALIKSTSQKREAKGFDGETQSKLKDIINMVKASFHGEYKVKKTTLLYLVGAMLYFVNPFDLIPDFILGIGYLDDMSVIAFVGNRLHKELERFKMTMQIQPLGVDLKRNE